MITASSISTQKGAVTIVVSTVLLIGITLIGLLAAKGVLVETKINAANYRMQQAMSAANYAMDYAVNYFDNGGFDQDEDGVVDSLVVPDLSSSGGDQITTATVSFSTAAGSRCVDAADTPSMSAGMITAIGLSDDGLSSRTITQCVGPISLLADDGPDMPLIARANVALTGNSSIVNRYTNVNIWTGEDATIGSSSAMETHIKDPSAGTLTEAQLLDTVVTNNTTLISNSNLGNGLDIIDNDPTLGDLTPADFFDNFFAPTREQIKELSKNADQYHTVASEAFNESGLIWVEGDHLLNSNGTIGSIDKPAIMIVNGDLTVQGNITFYGLLYVVGGFDVSGTISIVGSTIVEGDGAASSSVTGSGTLNLIFWKDFLNSASGAIPGLTAVIADSWRDW